MKKNTLKMMLALLIYSAAALAQDGLFISEVTDPADDYHGRFVELYNAGSEAVDFDNLIFFLTRQSNGGTSWGEVQLSGNIASGQTYVIGGSSFEALYGFAPNLVSGILTGNGDDAYSLYEGGGHSDGSLHDIFGVRNEDGTDTNWEYTDSRALRDDDVDDPRILWSSMEWTIVPADIADCNPGTHLGSVNQNPVVPEGSLAVVSDTVEWGELVNVAISTGALNIDDNIISFQFDLDYDETMLSYSDYSLTATMSDGGTVAINSEIPGMLSVSFMSPTPLVGSGPIIYLQFTSLTIGQTSLSISQALLNNTPVEEALDGSILIAEVAPPSGKIAYNAESNRYGDILLITATFSEAMLASVEVEISMSGAVTESGLEMSRSNDTVYTYSYTIPEAAGDVQVSFSGGADLWGNVVLSAPTEGLSFNILAFLQGDVNDDGEVQAFDAALVLQYSVAIDPLPEEDPMPWESWRQLSADVDENGNITAYDAGLILQYSAGIIDIYPTSARKALPNIEVFLVQEDGNLLIYAEGALVGINIEIEDIQNNLGDFVIENDAFLSAVNVLGEKKMIAMCMETFPVGRTLLTKMKVNGNGNINLVFLVNDQRLEKSVNLATDLAIEKRDEILIYPNPASSLIYIKGSSDIIDASLYDIQGRLLLEKRIRNDNDGIDVSEMKEGTYVLRLLGTTVCGTHHILVKH